MRELTVGSLFAGIGGFDLGLERAGMRTVWFCEQDEFCRRVLARHWPGVPCHPDVRALVADTRCEQSDDRSAVCASEDRTSSSNGRAIREASGRGRLSRTAHRSSHQDADGSELLPVPVPYVDVLCGGFPCQDISLAGRGAGLAGERSGLWREFARLIGELRPRYVLVENVPALTHRGLDVVLADLAACGFDAEWDHLPASAFGAPHRRDRIWLVAYPGQSGRDKGPVGGAGGLQAERPTTTGEPGGCREAQDMVDSDAERRNGRPGQLGPGRRGEPADPGWWLTEPDVGRVAHGIPARMDRLRALGNALVPQVAEWIGRQIVTYEEMVA